MSGTELNEDFDIVRARLIRRIRGVRTITDLSVAEADMALQMASDVINIVLSSTKPANPTTEGVSE